ncbi:MAG: hypothetical protein Q9187_007274, partial [Circinaria calcarea]
MFAAKSILFFALLATSAHVAVAAPPACLLAAVNTEPKPGDLDTVCGVNASKVQSQIQSLCGDNTSAAMDAFKSVCAAAGKTVRFATTTLGSGTGSASGATGSPIAPSTRTAPSGTASGTSAVFTGAASQVHVGSYAAIVVGAYRSLTYRSQSGCHRNLATVTTSSNTPAHSNLASGTPPYPRILKKLSDARRVLGTSRRLTLAEKILYSHLESPEESLLSNTQNGTKVRGNANLKLKPDRVAMQDASAQMALLQFMSCGLPSTAVPASIHCDHMIVGERGADVDLPASITGNKEVFDFLESAAKKYGIEFWPPGAGIIHQTVLENYAAPGLMMLGTDSHTPNAGGLGAIAIGVGGADAVDALVDAPWELKAPRILGVELKGSLSGWAAPKDVILKLAGLLTVRGGTGFVVEYFGSGVETLSCTGMATICNMGAEVGATTSLFPFTSSMIPYLESTHRGPIAKTAASIAADPGRNNLLKADTGAEYDEHIVIDLSTLEPHINGPFTPDLSTPLSLFKKAVETNQWPEAFGAGLIGSCTNSSYQDMTRAEDL